MGGHRSVAEYRRDVTGAVNPFKYAEEWFGISAFFCNPSGLRLRVYDTTSTSDFVEFLGWSRDIHMGAAEFDGRFTVRSNHPQHARHLYGFSELSVLADLPSPLELRIRRMRRLKSQPVPRGVDRLTLRISGPFSGAAWVAQAVRTFESIVVGLERVGRGAPEVDRLLYELRLVPEGQIVLRNSLSDATIVLWDGDRWREGILRDLKECPPSDIAAAVLPLLKERDLGVVVETIRLLGRIGDPFTVPAVVALLGNYAAGGDRVFHGHVTGFLKQMGRRDVVTAFDDVVNKGPTDLAPLRAFRAPVVEAFVNILGHGPTANVVNAARAVGQLGDENALPALRACVGRLISPSPRQVQIVSDAIVLLESRDRLPSPATAPATREALPRPALGVGVSAADLPRPSKPEED